MRRPIDEATERFLATATDALQRDIAVGTVTVQRLSLDETSSGVVLIATIRGDGGTTEARGAGENLVAAYADLRLRAAERILVSSFTDLIAPEA